MKKTLRNSLLMILVSVMLLGSLAFTTDAASKITVKPFSGKATYTKLKKKAKRVKKGTTIVNTTDSPAYIKFTAPKAKTYTFTFANFKMDGDAVGGIWFYKRKSSKSNKLADLTVKTEGGKTSVLLVSIKPNKNGVKSSRPLIDRYLPKRTAKVKLRKGQTIFIRSSTAHHQPARFKLVIK